MPRSFSANIRRATTNNFIDSKPHWGMDHILTATVPTALKKAYIRFATGSYGLRVEGSKPPLVCRLCNLSMETHFHVFVECPYLSTERKKLQKELSTKETNISHNLKKLTDKQTMHFLLGSGQEVVEQRKWEQVQVKVAGFINQIGKNLDSVDD